MRKAERRAEDVERLCSDVRHAYTLVQEAVSIAHVAKEMRLTRHTVYRLKGSEQMSLSSAFLGGNF